MARFFRHFAATLERRGVKVWRTVCEGGDYIETPAANRVLFGGEMAAWPEFINSVLREKHISAVITFNDCCPRTSQALAVATELKIPNYVMEQGYIRPWWITFDRDGVNGNSILPRDAAFYLEQNAPPTPYVKFKHTFRSLVRDTIVHYAASIALSPVLAYDTHYYGDGVLTQARGYVGEYVWRRTHSEGGILRRLQKLHSEAKSKIFIALLQKPGDAQLMRHSDFRANNPYIETVVASFAKNADPTSVLLVKQHPLDYGIENSPELFARLVREHGLEGRAFYSRTLTIESVLEVASGLVTVNSTGGLTAIQSLVPTIALGNAVYDMGGLTCQGGLDQFWLQPTPPDKAVVDAFLNYLMAKIQINGGFHTRHSRDLLSKNLSDVLTAGAWAPHHDLKRPRLLPALPSLGDLVASKTTIAAAPTV